MPATGTQLIERTRRFMGDWPQTDVTTASAASGGTTLTVASDANDRYHVNQFLEIAGEKILVTSVASSTTLTVRRGLGGTAAASIASGATILQSPRFFETEYLDAINYGIQSCWPWIYRPVIDTSISTTVDTYEYQIPFAMSENEISEANARFTDTIGDWTAGGTNTVATSATESYEGTASMLCTYQDDPEMATLLLPRDLDASAVYRAAYRIYIPAAWDGTDLEIEVSSLGTRYRQDITMTTTDEWQLVEIYFIPGDDLTGGSIGLRARDAPTAGRFVYVDDVTLGRVLGQPYISRVEVKVPGGDEFCKRRRWSVRRGRLAVTQTSIDTISKSGDILVLGNLEQAGSSVRLSGFGPFPDLVAPSDSLDQQWPIRAVYPLVEFAASYLMESGEARRVTVDRGLVDQREQANRVGASMQASQALLNRFERRIAAVGMPPMAGYPHVVPYIG